MSFIDVDNLIGDVWPKSLIQRATIGLERFFLRASDWNLAMQDMKDLRTAIISLISGTGSGGLAIATAGTTTTVLCATVDSSRGVMVSGFDSASNALDPVVYQADIVDGVSFTITHDTATSANKFFWRA
jgi:hypothetical protein